MTTEIQLKSLYDGLNLSVAVVRPLDKPRAVLQLAHGMCGCKERYIPFMEYMSDHGVACVASDHRGHGASVLSHNDLGYMYEGGYTALVEDMKVVSDWTADEFPESDLFLMGHSMGAMAARIYAKKYDGALSGLIVCGSPGYVPLARVGAALSGFMCQLKQDRLRPALIQNMVSSIYNRRFSSEGDMAWVCSDPLARKEMKDNPLCNYTFTVNGIYNLLSMMLEANSNKGWGMENPSLPITFLSGGDDPCMGSEEKLHDSAKMLYSMGYHNVSSAIFSQMRHEILNEVNKKVVWDDILDFIKENSS